MYNLAKKKKNKAFLQVKIYCFLKVATFVKVNELVAFEKVFF